jgi:hypothetical protein
LHIDAWSGQLHENRISDGFGNSPVPWLIAMLERNIAIAPTLSRAVELADLYHQAQRLDEETALLSRFDAELTVENGLVLRLAELLAGTGNRETAIQLLMRSERGPAAARSTGDQHTRLLLAGLLVQSGRSQEAVRFGKQWILQWHEPWLADQLLRSVVLRAPVAEASELAEAVAVLHPEIRLYLAHGLAAMGAIPIARHLLETWAAANPSPSMNEIAAFLSACREQDEPAIVWQAFGEVLRHPVSEDVITRYSEAIAAEFGLGALAPFWANLPKVIEQRSLLAAQLAFHENNPGLTKLLLEEVDLFALEAPDRRMWFDLLVAVASPPEAFEVLRGRRRSNRLSLDLLPQYARLAGGLGQEIDYRDALADLNRKAH